MPLKVWGRFVWVPLWVREGHAWLCGLLLAGVPFELCHFHGLQRIVMIPIIRSLQKEGGSW